MEKRTVSNKLNNLFYIAYFVIFSWLYFNVVFFNQSFPYQILPTIGCTFLFFSVFLVLYKLTKKQAAYISQHKKVFLILFFAILLCIQGVCFYELANYPTGDVGEVFNAAHSYAVAGTIAPFEEYLYKFSNNQGLFVILQFVFRVGRRLGMNSYNSFYLLGLVLNVVSIEMTYLFTFLTAEKLMDTQKAFLSIFMLLAYLPLHFFIGVYYTDTLSVAFPPLILYLYYCAKKAEGKKKWLYYLAIGLAAGIGSRIKFTILIVVVAIGVDFLLKNGLKKAISVVCCVLVTFTITVAGFNVYKNTFFDKEIAKDKKTPITAWVMMGLTGDGSYNTEDFLFVWHWETKEEKIHYSVQEIKQRVTAHGPLGMLQFLNKKGVRSFGSGNGSVSFYTTAAPHRQSFLLKAVQEDGAYFCFFDLVQQGYYLAVAILGIVGALMAYIRKDVRLRTVHLSLFGLYLFLLIWEAGQRYLVHFFPLFVLAGVFGMAATDKDKFPDGNEH